MKYDKNKVIVNGGVGFVELLTIVFVVLKLTGVINWSWFWVLSPVVLPILFAIAIFWIMLIYLMILNR